MKVGKVIGNVWATRKDQGLEGLKLLVVEIQGPKDKKAGETIIAVDMVGAGTGERVILVSGSSARHSTGKDIPVDASIIGIIDELEIYE